MHSTKPVLVCRSSLLIFPQNYNRTKIILILICHQIITNSLHFTPFPTPTAVSDPRFCSSFYSLQIDCWALLNSTGNTGSWKIFEMRCFKRKKKPGVSLYFSLFPPSLSPTFWVWWYPIQSVGLEQLKTRIEEMVSWQSPGASLVRRDEVIAHCQGSCFIEPTCSKVQACVINPVF